MEASTLERSVALKSTPHFMVPFPLGSLVFLCPIYPAIRKEPARATMKKEEQNGAPAISYVIEALQAWQDETIDKAVTKAVATALPKIKEHFDKRFDTLEQSVEQHIDAKFDKVIQAIRDIPND